MATPVPPPSPRHLRLLRLLLSGLVLGAALRGAAAGRPGERQRSVQAAGRPGARDRWAGGVLGGVAVILRAAALAPARRPRRPGPRQLRQPSLERDGANRPGPPRGSTGWGFSRVPAGEPEVNGFLSLSVSLSVSVSQEGSVPGPADAVSPVRLSGVRVSGSAV